MRYASIFFVVLVMWMAIVIIATLANDTDQTFQLYLMSMAFTLLLFLFGFTRRK